MVVDSGAYQRAALCSGSRNHDLGSRDGRRRHWDTIRQQLRAGAVLRCLCAFLRASVHEPGVRSAECSSITRSCSRFAGCSASRRRLRGHRSTALAAVRNERLIDICLACGATDYLSGPSALNYLDEAAFRSAGITIRVADYSGYPEYAQPHPPFDHAVSVLDSAVLHGPEGDRVHEGRVSDSFDRLMPSQRVDLSIVTSMFRSASHLEEFHARCTKAASSLTASYEIVLVNDGSADDSLRLALDYPQTGPAGARDRSLTEFRPPQGTHDRAGRMPAAIWCFSSTPISRRILGGFPRFATHSPRPAPMSSTASRRTRKGGWFERATGELFFSVFNQMLAQPIPANVVTARLMTRRYVQALVAHRDQEVFLAGLWMMTGFDQRPLTVTKESRSTSTYSPLRRLSVPGQRPHIVQQPPPDLHLRARRDGHPVVDRRSHLYLMYRRADGHESVCPDGRRSWCRSGFSAG